MVLITVCASFYFGIFLNGERGIRTLVRFDPKTVFETAAFNRSATSPGWSPSYTDFSVGLAKIYP